MKVDNVHLISFTTSVSESPVLIRWKAPPGYVRDPQAPRPRQWEHHELWFSKAFLWKDKQFRAFKNWTVDMDALTDTAITCAEAIEAATSEVDHSYLWAGVIVRHHNPDALYVLTGEADAEGLLRGVWPD